MGLFRRSKDAQPGDAGRYEELSPEAKAAAFDMQHKRSEKRAEDKRKQAEAAKAEKPKGRHKKNK